MSKLLRFTGFWILGILDLQSCKIQKSTFYNFDFQGGYTPTHEQEPMEAKSILSKLEVFAWIFLGGSNSCNQIKCRRILISRHRVNVACVHLVLNMQNVLFENE